nr:hypothetical protein [Tissierella sp.]
MIKLDLKSLLLNIFQEDKSKNEAHTVFSQLAMITIKSLMPSDKTIGNTIDYKRFEEELKLLRYYKLDAYNHFKRNLDETEYFNYKDKTLYSRILPIILSNKDYGIVEEEVIKNIIYTTGNIETLLEGLTISKVLFLAIEDGQNLLEALKQYIINLSQVEYLEKYRDLYQYDLLKNDVNFEVSFERERVSLITLLHGIDMGKFKDVKDILKVLEGEEAKTSLGRIIFNSIKEKPLEYDMEDSYERMGDYILKLRNSRIDPDALKIERYELPDIFKFEEGEVFFHSLLNHSKVIKKETKDDSLISLIQTRAGMYLFNRDPFN